MSESPESPSQNPLDGPRYVLPPWRVSVFSSACALVLALLYAVFPLFEHVRLPLIPAFSAAYLVGFVSAVAAGWSVAAVARRQRDGHSREATLGLVISMTALAFTLVAAIGYASR